MSDIAPDSTNKDFYYFYEKYEEKNTPLFAGPNIPEDNELTEKQGENLIISPDNYIEEDSCIKSIIEANVDDEISVFDTSEPRLTETDNNDRKEYVITKSDIELDGTEILDVFTELEEDNESTLVLGEQLDPIPCWTIEYSDGTSDFWCSQVPLRPVAISKIFQEIKRVRSYFLTDQEAEALRSDLRVKAVEIPAEQNGGFITTDATDHFGSFQSGNFTRSVAGFNDPYDLLNIILCPFPNCGQNSWNGIDFIPGEEVIQVLNSGPFNIEYSLATAKGTILTWHDGRRNGSIYYWPMINVVNYTGNFVASDNTTSQFIKGVTSGAIFRITNFGIGKFLQQDSNWGLPRTNSLGNTEEPVPDRYNYMLDGTGVDVIIIDTGIYPDHPEFQDADGNSRVVQHNWYVEAGRPAEANKQHQRFYTDQSGHGTHVAGTVAGKTFGWAKNAKIYSMKIMGAYTIPYQEAFDLIAAWHNRKPIDTETGTRRPTIVNCSWSWRRSIGFGPPMIYGGKWSTTAPSTALPSVWNEDTTSTGITELYHKGILYDKNSYPISGNLVDSQRLDLFNTGPKTYDGNVLPAIYRDVAQDYNGFWRTFASPLHYIEIFTFGKDYLNRDLLFSRITVNAEIDYVNEGIQTMIDAGIHVCIAAGNNKDLVAREGDSDYNNYALYETYPNSSGFATKTTEDGWVLGSSTNYSTPLINKVFFNRKTSPYATDAIIVGSLDSQTRKTGNWRYTMTFNNDVKDSTPEGDELKSGFSNFGLGIDVYAPGSHIISCVPNYHGNTNGVFVPSETNYNYTTYRVQPYYYDNTFSQVKISGTSMASPQVCGFGALLLQAYPDLTPYELKYLIKGLSHKTTLVTPDLYFTTQDKWGRNVTLCNFLVPISNNSCSPDRADVVTFNYKVYGTKAFTGMGDVNEVNILYNPYSTTLPSDTDIIIRRILAADNPVELVAVTNGYSFMRVMWNESNGEDLVGYIVERSLSENGVYVQLFNTPITGRFYDDYSSEPDVTYYYRVVAVGENSSKSTPSNVVFGTRIPIRQILVVETPISDLEGTATTKSINLAWKPAIAQDHVEYEVRRSTNPNSGFVKINSSPITTTNYSDTEISSLVKYYYRVYSKNIKNEYSPDSPTVEVKALELIGRAPIDGGKLLPFDPNPIEPILPTEPPTEPTIEPSTETPFEPIKSSPWFYKGNVTVTKINTDNDALKVTSRSWCQAGISTLGKENIKLRFTFENNNYEVNEFLAVLCYINNEWKIIFVGRNNDGPREYEIDLDESLSNKSEVLIRFHSFTTSLSSDKWVNVSEVSLFGTLI
jgi:subtilisin family serine protease